MSQHATGGAIVSVTSTRRVVRRAQSERRGAASAQGSRTATTARQVATPRNTTAAPLRQQPQHRNTPRYSTPRPKSVGPARASPGKQSLKSTANREVSQPSISAAVELVKYSDIDVIVRSLTGDVVTTLQIGHRANVAAVKKLVWQQAGVVSARQQLLHAGVVLEDACKLAVLPHPVELQLVKVQVEQLQQIAHIGMRVKVGGEHLGTIRYCGHTEFASGDWLGIEMDDMIGKHDGTVQGVSYFQCPPSHGVFVRPNAASPYRDTIQQQADLPSLQVSTAMAGARSKVTQSDEFLTCSICLEQLSGQPIGVCLGSDGHRVCQHYFHLNCLRRVEGARCPQCRVRFHKRADFPSLFHEPARWCSHVSSGNKRELTRREVAEALKATLLLAPEEVDALVESSWQYWTRGEESLRFETLEGLKLSVVAHMPDTSGSRCNSPRISAEDQDSAKLEDGHSRSGVVCSCGQIHVRRGDRVCRGPVASDIDSIDITTGQLGTIVRIGERQESVIVKWDRSAGDDVHCYTWPDPDGMILAPASFGELAPDVLELQRQTELSSAAAETLFRRMGYSKENAINLFKLSRRKNCEEKLRKPPKLFHRVRILPDKLLIQQWFDSLPPCQCNNSRCTGGVQWSSRAEKHLGREALVLNFDTDDDTVLVETRGPCNCQIWYPRLAVEPVHDPDLADDPLFEVNDRVECMMKTGWEKGVVTEVLWRGANRQGPCPYVVKLDDGSEIFVPDVVLIRKI